MYLPINRAYGLILLLLFSCYPLFAGAQSLVTHPSEADALLAIKEALIDINNNLSNWNIGDPCTSNWTGIKCYNKTLPDGYLHVSDLQLFGMNLSGHISPEIGRLSYLKIVDFMWNTITGNIPKEIGNISTLELLLLNRNQLSGPMPEELGYLTNLNRIQIDENHISGSIPISFANLISTQHFHMNNNSISGEIPRELSTLPKLVHFLLDNNNLSGPLPPELSAMPNLTILQLDNNNLGGSTIPDSYGNMTTLLKLSLRNCSLQGPIPDLSRIPQLSYIDLSFNKLNNSIPQNKLSQNITTIILSDNNLTGPIPTTLSGLPLLQKLSMENNMLTGSIPSGIWQSRPSNNFDSVFVNLQNNQLSNISGSINLPPNVTVWLHGNPACSDLSLSEFCLSENGTSTTNGSNPPIGNCLVAVCPPSYECSPTLCPSKCICAAPLIVGYRLKSPGFSDFIPYQRKFIQYLTSGLAINPEQLLVSSFWWEEGPRLGMSLKFFPANDNNNSSEFTRTEIQRIMYMFTAWKIPDNATFGPYEVTGFYLSDIYKDVSITTTSSMSTGELAGIIVGAIAGGVILSAIVSLLIARAYIRKHRIFVRRRPSSTSFVKIEGVKQFTYEEMALATNNFDNFALVGQGGYGKVYRGILREGSIVAIKRAQEGSLQGEKEFLTEIQLLSRLHHRNLVSLIGYCDEEGEQMLVYEFMSNGTLRDHLSVNSKEPLSFFARLRIALASAKGILYLHTEADPPIFHRDIKASNILLDSKLIAKVADFGLSRLAAMPDIEGSAPAPISTVVKGTPGYLDPEYFLTQKLTDKSDVYSFGVVLLELLTGMHPISHGKNIVREVKRMYQSGKIFSVIDSRMGSYPSEVVERFMSLALKCCQDESDGRPSMADVVRVLESICVTAPEPDSRGSESSVTDAKKAPTSPSSSSSLVRSFYVSTDVSGSELVSGTVPTITPR